MIGIDKIVACALGSCGYLGGCPSKCGYRDACIWFGQGKAVLICMYLNCTIAQRDQLMLAETLYREGHYASGEDALDALMGKSK